MLMTAAPVTEEETLNLADPSKYYASMTANGCTAHQAYTVIKSMLARPGHAAAIAAAGGYPPARAELARCLHEWALIGWPPPW